MIKNKTSEKKAKPNRLSEISADVAQIALASVIAPFLIDRFDLGMLLSGLTTAFAFWTVSLILAR